MLEPANDVVPGLCRRMLEPTNSTRARNYQRPMDQRLARRAQTDSATTEPEMEGESTRPHGATPDFLDNDL